MAIKKEILLPFGIGLFVVGFVSGFWIGSRGGSLTGVPLKTQLQQAQSNLERAKKVLPPIAEHTSAISGTIQSISGNTLMLKANLFNPLEDLPAIRAVTITNTTGITILKQKDPLTYQKELVAFEKNIASQSKDKPAPVMPSFPTPFLQVRGTLADLKPGQSINVITDVDITRASSFEAKAIQVSATK